MKDIQMFSEVCDQILFEEVAGRLKRLYQKEHGSPFLYGSFEFIFHQGKFQCIEERARNRRYLSITGPSAAGRAAK